MDRSVDGISLGETPHRGIVRIDVGKVSPSVEQRLGISVGACHLYALVHILLHLREVLEVSFYQLLCLVAAYLQSFRQTEHRNAVDDAEVGTLCLCALVSAHLVDGFFVYLRRRGSVDVVSLAERFYHVLVAAQVSHHSQLYLTVVGREEFTARFRYESLSYLLSVLAPHRNILQVGIARRQASRGSHGLVERCVNPPRSWIDKLRQSIHIRAEEFLQPSVFQDVSHNLVLAFQRLQYLLVGDILSCFCLLRLLHDFHLFKQHLAHLFR